MEKTASSLEHTEVHRRFTYLYNVVLTICVWKLTMMALVLLNWMVLRIWWKTTFYKILEIPASFCFLILCLVACFIILPILLWKKMFSNLTSWTVLSGRKLTGSWSIVRDRIASGITNYIATIIFPNTAVAPFATRNCKEKENAFNTLDKLWEMILTFDWSKSFVFVI